jgi:hypothetical protein
MSIKCPICDQILEEDKICSHFIMMVHEENLEDSYGPPISIETDLGKYAQTLDETVDEFYSNLVSLTSWLNEKPNKILKADTPLGSLLRNLREEVKIELESESYDDAFSCFDEAINPDLNSYIQDVYSEVCDDFFIETQRIMGGVGLVWYDNYFWSENAEKTAKAMISLIKKEAQEIANVFE